MLKSNLTSCADRSANINRSVMAFKEACAALAKEDNNWSKVKIVMHLHDEITVQGPGCLVEEIVIVLRDAMKNPN